MELILAALIGGAALGAWAWRKHREKTQQKVLEATRTLKYLDRGLNALRPDDIVNINNRDWIVVGVAQLSDGVQSWDECRLLDGKSERWLLVHRSDLEHLVFGEVVEDIVHGGQPSDSLERQGEVFGLKCHGQVKVTYQGDLGPDYPAQAFGYWDYERPGDTRIWIRGGNSEVICFSGIQVPRHIITFLPGS